MMAISPVKFPRRKFLVIPISRLCAVKKAWLALVEPTMNTPAFLNPQSLSGQMARLAINLITSGL
jgi:hypothetical protein